jgi:uncharacterized membrane protein SirB2
MFEYYVQIKAVHVSAVLLSGSLFLARGIGTECGGRWPASTAIRVLSWTIDTALLTAALMLATMLPPGVFANGWLWWKLSAVAAYIGAASVALRPRLAMRARRIGLVLAVLLFATAASIARAHDPRGFLLLLAS